MKLLVLAILLINLIAFFSARVAAFNLINIAETAPRDVASMEAWSRACGVQTSPGFQLTSQDGRDFGVTTTEDLPANTCVLFVPSPAILSSNQAQQEIGPVDAVQKLMGSSYVSQQTRQLYLMFQILLEYEKGEQSPWFPYLNSLPRYYQNGASMTSFCFKCLPPLVGELAKQERARLSTLRTILQKVPFLSEQTRNDRELIRWAFQIAYTRSIETDNGSNDLCIAPMADMLDHGSADLENVAIRYDPEGNCYAHTTKDVAAGSPLCRSYGDSTNPSFLFARYGFLDDSSPATFCKIMIDKPTQQQIDMGYDHSRMLFYKDSGEVSPEVFDVLLYQLLDGTSDQQEFYQAHMQGDQQRKQAFHEHYWPQTAGKLQEHIDTFLNQLDELSARSKGKREGSNAKRVEEHPRLPIILQHNEFVRWTFLAVRYRYFS